MWHGDQAGGRRLADVPVDERAALVPSRPALPRVRAAREVLVAEAERHALPERGRAAATVAQPELERLRPALRERRKAARRGPGAGSDGERGEDREQDDATGHGRARRMHGVERRRRRGASAAALGGLAVVLAAADLLTKALLRTPEYAFHTRPFWQLATGMAIGATLVVAVVAVGSVAVATAAGIAIGGTVGNLSSVAIWGAAPNPFLVPVGAGVVAFNLADVLVVSGAALIPLAATALAHRHRPALRARL
jgi:hypothetical protein